MSRMIVVTKGTVLRWICIADGCNYKPVQNVNWWLCHLEGIFGECKKSLNRNEIVLISEKEFIEKINSISNTKGSANKLWGVMLNHYNQFLNREKNQWKIKADKIIEDFKNDSIRLDYAIIGLIKKSLDYFLIYGKDKVLSHAVDAFEKGLHFNDIDDSLKCHFPGRDLEACYYEEAALLLKNK